MSAKVHYYHARAITPWCPYPDLHAEFIVPHPNPSEGMEARPVCYVCHPPASHIREARALRELVARARGE